MARRPQAGALIIFMKEMDLRARTGREIPAAAAVAARIGARIPRDPAGGRHHRRGLDRPLATSRAGQRKDHRKEPQ